MLIVYILAVVYLLCLPRVIAIYLAMPKDCREEALRINKGSKASWFFSMWLASPVIFIKMWLK